VWFFIIIHLRSNSCSGNHAHTGLSKYHTF
jgi:hypothetical protein